MVSVDHLNNSADSRTQLGSVPYFYEIGKYDVTAREYATFLNAVAKSDPHHLYDKVMIEDPFINEIEQLGEEGCYFYRVIPGREDLPVTGLNFFSAARFCNWMENGQPMGEENNSTTEDGSYLFAFGRCIEREKAHWLIPTENEWYKAAYYNKSDPTHYWSYATESNKPPGNSAAQEENRESSPKKNANYCIHSRPTCCLTTPLKNAAICPCPADMTPVGSFQASPGPFGTYDMSGNAAQWTTGLKILNDHPYLAIRGGSRYDGMTWGKCSMNDRIDYLGVQFATPKNFSCSVGFRVIHLTPSSEIARWRGVLINLPIEGVYSAPEEPLWSFFY